MNLPQAFLEQLRTQFGKEAQQQLADVIQQGVSPVSIRINAEKMGPLPLTAVPWAAHGYYLDARPVFTQDPLLHAGAYYVQEASSMMLEQVVRQAFPSGPLRVLDLCAAPGGKSTHLASLLTADDLLVANDTIQARARVLQENLTKWGSDCVVTNNDPKDFGSLDGFFDVLVVDAPCSGEGLFRRDHAAIAEWSEANVALCGQRQQRILADAWDALCADGLLVYSTCTFNQTENEAVLNWLISTFEVAPVKLDLSAFVGVRRYEVQGYEGYKLLPGEVAGEGYCFFVLRKNGGSPKKVLPTHRKQAPLKPVQVEGVKATDNFLIQNWDGLLMGTRFTQEVDFLKKQLRVLKSGVLVGEQKKNKLVPSHELALSGVLEPSAWVSSELTYAQALCFLMKEPFELPGDQRGFVLLTFAGVPLGWVNHLGNRVNSLYPANWRILKDFRSEAPFSVIHFL